MIFMLFPLKRGILAEPAARRKNEAGDEKDPVRFD
jgi:hypothetical protein